jgi:hypothetical protein
VPSRSNVPGADPLEVFSTVVKTIERRCPIARTPPLTWSGDKTLFGPS